MGRLGMALIVGIIAARVFVAWAETGTADPDFDVSADPCDDWTEWLGVGDCSGFNFGTLALGIINGLPAVLNLLSGTIQTVVLIFSFIGIKEGV